MGKQQDVKALLSAQLQVVLLDIAENHSLAPLLSDGLLRRRIRYADHGTTTLDEQSGVVACTAAHVEHPAGIWGQQSEERTVSSIGVHVHRSSIIVSCVRSERTDL